MSAGLPEDIQKHVRVYIMVFVALAALTVVTVAVSYLDLSTAGAVLVALVIALAKGSLVAAFFMHLISERQIIYVVLIFCTVFFLALMVGPWGTHAEYPEFLHPASSASAHSPASPH